MIISLLLSAAVADVYMQNPRGSNNKLFEQSNTVSNNARLYDSQNNDEGGYQVLKFNKVGDKCIPNCLDPNTNQYLPETPGSGMGIMEFYEGSELQVEWTNQHGSQNPSLDNQIVLQYMCDDGIYSAGLRDGRTTATIPTNPATANIEQFGQHENHAWYQECTTRERNNGLFTADQALNGPTAQFTRQNRNGQRRGLECPEERDYYPYWHPTPWRDIMVCTNTPSRCGYYKTESQNVLNKGLCSNAQFNNPKKCVDNGGTWTESGSFNTYPPECKICPSTRYNHLGNAEEGKSPSYTWKIPFDIHADGATCVLRIRYNISTTDVSDDSWNIFANSNGALKNNPTNDFVGLGANVSGPIRLNINTAQYGRTFEDRSHVFKIRKRPSNLDCGLRVPRDCRIVNYNVRGRRGNIVQVYPSVEYDFVPSELKIARNDYLHIQWTGSDANSQGNAGNGRTGTDRSNMVVMPSYSGTKVTNMNIFERRNTSALHFSNNASAVAYMAFLGQTGCNDAQTNTNADDYCKLHNRAPAYINMGLVQMHNMGKYLVMSTRNHAFSNRDQKASIVVEEDLVLAYGSAAIAVGGAGIIGACIFFGLKRYKKKTDLLDTEKSEADASNLGGKAELLVKYPVLGKFIEWWAWNYPRMIFGIFICMCQVGAFLFGYFTSLNNTYKAPYFPFAKGFGKMLDFNLSFVFIPILRNFISYVRTTPAGSKLPLDDNLNIHRIVGYLISLDAFGHIFFHCLDFMWDQNNQAIPFTSSLFATAPGLTGVFITLLMTVMYMFAMMQRKIYTVFGRRFDGYELFLRLHQLWIPIYILLWIHGSQFWQFSVFPLLFVALEKFIQSRRTKRDVKLVEAKLVGRDVLMVKMQLANTKKKFRYKAGQYLFLCCPAVNEREYHPFTITSAPEDQFFSCHIRCRQEMDWTYSLRTKLGFANASKSKDVQLQPTSSSLAVKAVDDADDQNSILLKVDGPYGSASEEVFDYDAAILVGAGIGVTPFISILKSISLRAQLFHTQQENLNINFFWICRDQNEFDSFKDFFIEIVRIKFPGSLTLNMYCTGEMNLKEVQAADYNQFSGRPNWNRIFKETAQRHKGSEIGVFLCGPEAIAQQLEVACKAHSSKRSKAVNKGESRTLFKFHKENF